MAKTQCAVPGCKNTASKRYDDRPAVCLSCYRTLPRNGNVPVIPGLDDEPQAVEADSILLAHNDTPEPKRLWRQGIDVLHQVQKLSDRSRGRIETHIATQILTDTP